MSDQIQPAEHAGAAEEPRPERPERTPEARAMDGRIAAARRKAERERDEAVRRSRIDAERERREAVEELLSALRAERPDTHEPIRTEEDWRAYRREAAAREEAEEAAAETAPGPETEKTEAPGTPEPASARAEAEAKAAVEAQVRAIAEMDPAIASIEDFPKMKHYAEFRDNVLGKGMSFVDAYNLSHMEERLEAARAAGRQAARNTLSGKAHLLSRESRGEGQAEVPPEVERMYRRLDPRATRQEISRLYRRTKNE